MLRVRSRRRAEGTRQGEKQEHFSLHSCLLRARLGALAQVCRWWPVLVTPGRGGRLAAAETVASAERIQNLVPQAAEKAMSCGWVRKFTTSLGSGLLKLRR